MTDSIIYFKIGPTTELEEWSKHYQLFWNCHHWKLPSPCHNRDLCGSTAVDELTGDSALWEIVISKFLIKFYSRLQLFEALSHRMQEEPEVATFGAKFSGRWQHILDKLIPHMIGRWIVFTLSLYAYVIRVYFLNGWFIVTYGLGIYLLNQLLGFISPQVSFALHETITQLCFIGTAGWKITPTVSFLELHSKTDFLLL